MELKEFIKDVLVQIVEGVESAKVALKDKDVLINPSTDTTGKRAIQENGSRMIQNIEINLSVTVEGKEGAKQGIGVVAGMFSLGASGSQEQLNRSANNVKFTIPISLPFTGGTNEWWTPVTDKN